MRNLPRASLLLLVAVLGAACSDGGPSRVIVVGFDGLDRRALDRMLAEGRLASFARLRQKGAYARLVTPQPVPDDEALWRILASGARDPTGAGALAGAAQPSGKPFWDVMAEAGRQVAIVAWPGARPPSRGLYLSDRKPEGLGSAEQAEAARQVARPPELLSRLEAVAPTAPGAGPTAANTPQTRLERSLAASEAHAALALDVWRKERPDLLALVYSATDVASQQAAPLSSLPPASGAAEEVKRLLDVSYGSADRLLGRLLAAMDRRTTLVVVSDHGFERSAEGVVYLFGRGVRPAGRITAPTPYDVAPTVLALANLPAPAGLAGRIMAEALRAGAPHRRGASRAAAAGPPAPTRDQADASFRAGRYAEAAASYQRLVEREPADASLRASLAGALGAAGRHDDALKQLDVAVRLAPLDPTTHHNRAATFESLGRREEAIEEYRAAARYDAGYEPARRALQRLTGSADPDPPRNEQERRARALADAAAEAGRAEDYRKALSLLDQAERLAPRYALVQQYRSNVAYLMGDQAAAIRALEKAIALDPGNALLVANLEGLKRRPRPD